MAEVSSNVLAPQNEITEALLRSVFNDVKSVLCARSTLRALVTAPLPPLTVQQKRVGQKAAFMLQACSPKART